jgi:hypothetical protein
MVEDRSHGLVLIGRFVGIVDLQIEWCASGTFDKSIFFLRSRSWYKMSYQSGSFFEQF